ncbi:DM13 domain-containing protein [Alisedimentitalea sp. MJ-SS2]|uniref:DM13 domain-containing protein n=1 Tax=Aliisedimentitalea sp. MJ-SS2 TaxID=3049795 RepID=UPI00290EAA20|nr:DM13 domain-containing protein [Alisedimentitalea sp. MJ-SS2]MDU8926832.1 DM13 domain-containing protein [Alisedimentitalea sp. MJ-SS2]
MRRAITLTTHFIAIAFGFALGVYFLPILTAPPSPDAATLDAMAQDAVFTAEFSRDLLGSDFLHWGEGTVSLTPTQLVHKGALAPGPDYMAYLVPNYVTHEDEFLPIKDRSLAIGPVKTFKGFALDLPDGVNPEEYNTVLIWCEAFSEFITAAKYR